jgi:transcriptional regulator with XRE-family HTH domain
MHAARAYAGWSRRELAARARVNKETIAIWERSSDSAVRTTTAHLSRALAALASAGVTITEDGAVRLQRPAQVSTTLHSEEITA